MKNQLQNSIKNGYESDIFELNNDPILDYYVQNQHEIDDLTYIITYKNYLRKDHYYENNDFIVYEGNQAIIPHIIKNRRYFGNTKLIESDVFEMKHMKYSRLIKVNNDFFFIDSMLFVKHEDTMYRLRETEGFLQLHTWQKHAPKLI